MRRSPRPGVVLLSPLFLVVIILVSACGSPGTVAPVSQVSVSDPSSLVDPPPAPSAPPPPRAEAPPDPGPPGCFTTPINFGTQKGRGVDRFTPTVVNADLYAKLMACPGESDPLECKYQIARTYFEARHFAEAGAAFRDVARSGADHELAVHAAQLYLECLNVIGSNAEPPRTVCFDEMAEETPALYASFCGPKPKPANAELCDLLIRIEMDVARLKAEKLIMQADRGDADATSLFRRGGDAYMAIFNKFCAFSRPDKKQKPVPPLGWTSARVRGCSEVLYNAARSFQAAREMDLAERARQTMLDPIHQLDRTDLAKRVATEMRR
jgi:hypothetical protein